MNLLKSILYSIGLYRKRCGDCRHWSNVLAPQFDGFGMCRKSTRGEAQKMRTDQHGAYLETQPDFCCRLWSLECGVYKIHPETPWPPPPPKGGLK